MPKLAFLSITLIFIGLYPILAPSPSTPISISGAPPYGEPESSAPSLGENSWILSWHRPEGPAKVALQIGHWRSAELPEELARLRANTGSSGSGKSEPEVNLAIAKETAKLLRQKGIAVDLLPATIPPSYWADVFVAVHADGSEDLSTHGFKLAAPWRDFTGHAENLVQSITTSYQSSTNLPWDDNITRNMRGYYAFSWWRYEHALHPMTTAVILETGFLTNPNDAALLIHHPELPAQGITEGIINYLSSQSLL